MHAVNRKMTEWKDKGCKVCREWWSIGSLPKSISQNSERRSVLYLCEDCGSYWEEFERYADIIDGKDISMYYERY